MTKKLERTPIESLGMELQNIQQSIAGIYRIGEFLKEKENQGNPINPTASPVTFHYGYDIVDLIYKSSGMVTQIFTIDNVDLGIRAEYIDVLISRKI